MGSRPWSRTREVVIPNGIPLPEVPTPTDKARARRELGLNGDDFVVGIVARLSAQKAHEVLFEAFAALVESHPNARLVVVGGGDREAELRRVVVQDGIEERVLFTGIRRDVGALLPAFDVSALSSVHEGVPLDGDRVHGGWPPRRRHRLRRSARLDHRWGARIHRPGRRQCRPGPAFVTLADDHAATGATGPGGPDTGRAAVPYRANCRGLRIAVHLALVGGR